MIYIIINYIIYMIYYLFILLARINSCILSVAGWTSAERPESATPELSVEQEGIITEEDTMRCGLVRSGDWYITTGAIETPI